MHQWFILLVSLGNVNIIEIRQMHFNHTLRDMNINNSLLISQRKNRVTILLIFIGKIRYHLVLF